MAGYVIMQCVMNGGGQGGFMTYGITRMLNNVLDPMVDITNLAHYRKVHLPTIF